MSDLFSGKTTNTEQKIDFSNKDFFSKCNQILSFLQIWSHLLKKFLMEVSVFVLCKFLSKACTFKKTNFRKIVNIGKIVTHKQK